MEDHYKRRVTKRYLDSVLDTLNGVSSWLYSRAEKSLLQHMQEEERERASYTNKCAATCGTLMNFFVIANNNGPSRISEKRQRDLNTVLYICVPLSEAYGGKKIISAFSGSIKFGLPILVM
jgi:hypothetical protein